MAQKRMFDKAIIDMDKFMDLSMTAKAMYFLLGMEADDEGFVSYKKVLRIHGGNEDDVKLLIAKEFLIHFPSGVVVITDWNSNNYLDKNRLRPTEYQFEKSQLVLTANKKYGFNNGLTRGEERSIEELSAKAESVYTITSDLEEEKPKRTKKVTPDMEAVFNLFDNPARVNWKLREVERVSAQTLFDTYGLEVLKRRLDTIKKEDGKGDPHFPLVTTPSQLLDKMPNVERYLNI